MVYEGGACSASSAEVSCPGAASLDWLADAWFLRWAVASRPDARGRLWLAATGLHGELRLWDLRSGEPGPALPRPPSLVGRPATVNTCAIAPGPDGEGRFWLAATDNEGHLLRWNVAGDAPGQVLYEGGADSCLACAIAPAPDARGRHWLAWGGWRGTLRLWDLAASEMGPVLTGPDTCFKVCAFAPEPDTDGRFWLITGGYQGRLRLWDVAKGEAGPSLAGHQDHVTACAFAPRRDAQGRLWLATGDAQGGLRLWVVHPGGRVESGPPLLDPGAARGAGRERITTCALAFAPGPGGREQLWLVTGNTGGVLRLWAAFQGEPGPVLAAPMEDDECSPWDTLPVDACGFSPVPDVPGGLCLLASLGNRQLRRWALPGTQGGIPEGEDAGPVRPLAPWLGTFEPQIGACAVTACDALDGTPGLIVALAGDSGGPRLWDGISGKLRQTFTGHGNIVTACSLSAGPDARGRYWLASSSYDGTVRMWPLGVAVDAERDPPARCFTGHQGIVWTCALAPLPDALGRLWLASGGHDNTLRLWEVMTGEPGPVFLGHDPCHGYDGGVRTCAFAPGPDALGRYWLASGGGDGTLRLWDVAKAQAGPVLRGHAGAVTGCAFAPAPDGAGRLWLASGGEDRTLRLWRADTGESGPVLSPHGFLACAFAPEPDAQGRLWLAGALDDGVQLWDLSLGVAVGPLLRVGLGRVTTCALFFLAAEGEAPGPLRLTLATGADDGTLRLWDVATGQCLRITALCRGDLGSDEGVGVASWDPRNNRIIEVQGNAWRYLGWLRRVPGAMPERWPLNSARRQSTTTTYPGNG